MGWTTDELVESVKLRGGVPRTQVTFTTQRFLSLATEQLYSKIVSYIRRTQSDILRITHSEPLAAAQSDVVIPTRAMAVKIADVKLVIPEGRPKRLGRVEPEQASAYWDGTSQGEPRVFYLSGPILTVLPPPSDNTYTLQLPYYRRPSRLVPTTSCARITGIAGAILTVDATPSGFLVAALCDIVQSNPHFRILLQDSAIVAISATTIEFASVPASVAIGDYVCLAQESCIPQIPAEFWPALAQATVSAIMRTQNDFSGASKSDEELDRLLDEAIDLISERDDGQPSEIVNLDSAFVTI